MANIFWLWTCEVFLIVLEKIMHVHTPYNAQLHAQ
jgi:hypothetical protein